MAKAVGKVILIEKIKEEVKTDYDLYLGETATKDIRYSRGIVKHTGRDVDPIIKEGDVVYYDKVRGYTMMLKGKVITVIREADVVFVDD